MGSSTTVEPPPTLAQSTSLQSISTSTELSSLTLLQPVPTESMITNLVSPSNSDTKKITTTVPPALSVETHATHSKGTSAVPSSSHHTMAVITQAATTPLLSTMQSGVKTEVSTRSHVESLFSLGELTTTIAAEAAATPTLLPPLASSQRENSASTAPESSHVVEAMPETTMAPLITLAQRALSQGSSTRIVPGSSNGMDATGSSTTVEPPPTLAQSTSLQSISTSTALSSVTLLQPRPTESMITNSVSPSNSDTKIMTMTVPLAVSEETNESHGKSTLMLPFSPDTKTATTTTAAATTAASTLEEMTQTRVSRSTSLVVTPSFTSNEEKSATIDKTSVTQAPTVLQENVNPRKIASTVPSLSTNTMTLSTILKTSAPPALSSEIQTNVVHISSTSLPPPSSSDSVTMTTQIATMRSPSSMQSGVSLNMSSSAHLWSSFPRELKTTTTATTTAAATKTTTTLLPPLSSSQRGTSLNNTTSSAPESFNAAETTPTTTTKRTAKSPSTLAKAASSQMTSTIIVSESSDDTEAMVTASTLVHTTSSQSSSIREVSESHDDTEAMGITPVNPPQTVAQAALLKNRSTNAVSKLPGRTEAIVTTNVEQPLTQATLSQGADKTTVQTLSTNNVRNEGQEETQESHLRQSVASSIYASSTSTHITASSSTAQRHDQSTLHAVAVTPTERTLHPQKQLSSSSDDGTMSTKALETTQSNIERSASEKTSTHTALILDTNTNGGIEETAESDSTQDAVPVTDASSSVAPGKMTEVPLPPSTDAARTPSSSRILSTTTTLHAQETPLPPYAGTSESATSTELLLTISNTSQGPWANVPKISTPSSTEEHKSMPENVWTTGAVPIVPAVPAQQPVSTTTSDLIALSSRGVTSVAIPAPTTTQHPTLMTSTKSETAPPIRPTTSALASMAQTPLPVQSGSSSDVSSVDATLIGRTSSESMTSESDLTMSIDNDAYTSGVSSGSSQKTASAVQPSEAPHNTDDHAVTSIWVTPVATNKNTAEATTEVIPGRNLDNGMTKQPVATFIPGSLHHLSTVSAPVSPDISSLSRRYIPTTTAINPPESSQSDSGAQVTTTNQKPGTFSYPLSVPATSSASPGAITNIDAPVSTPVYIGEEVTTRNYQKHETSADEVSAKPMGLPEAHASSATSANVITTLRPFLTLLTSHFVGYHTSTKSPVGTPSSYSDDAELPVPISLAPYDNTVNLPHDAGGATDPPMGYNIGQATPPDFATSGVENGSPLQNTNLPANTINTSNSGTADISNSENEDSDSKVDAGTLAAKVCVAVAAIGTAIGVAAAICKKCCKPAVDDISSTVDNSERVAKLLRFVLEKPYLLDGLESANEVNAPQRSDPAFLYPRPRICNAANIVFKVKASTTTKTSVKNIDVKCSAKVLLPWLKTRHVATLDEFKAALASELPLRVRAVVYGGRLYCPRSSE